MVSLSKYRLTVATVLYAGVGIVLWFESRGYAGSFHGSFPRVFAAFLLLLAPIWFLGFGAEEQLKQTSRPFRVVFATLFSLPYFVLASGTPEFSWRLAALFIGFPVCVALLLGFKAQHSRMNWQDVVALTAVMVLYFLKFFEPGWIAPRIHPPPGLALFSKLFLADVVLYSFLVVRELEGMGYSLVPTRSGFVAGVREWLFYIPIAFVIGEAIGFVSFHAAVPRSEATTAVLVTFLLIAVPEELFFRAVLQNLLETRFGRLHALWISAFLFGLSHFHHGSRFNWRYVLLASIAGIFYGRAWRTHRQVFASALTHTAVDVVWSLWFR